MSSVLTALGVPGGTAAKTLDDAYLEELSRPRCGAKTQNINYTFEEVDINKCCTYDAMWVSGIGNWRSNRLRATVIVQSLAGLDC